MERNFVQILDLKTDTAQSQVALVELSDAVERLYHVFASYTLKPKVHRCTHCVREEDERRIRSKPLRKLMPEELEKYGHKAMTTWGDADDFRHFLPRFLEFYPFIGMGLLPPEILFSKLTYGNWRQWPQREQDALEDYFYALWKFSLLSIEPTPLTYSESFLCAIAQAVDDLSRFLIYWQQSDDPVALRNLAAFIQQNSDCFHRFEKQAQTFWEQRTEQWDQIVNWLTNQHTVQYVAAKMQQVPELEEELGDVLVFLQNSTRP